MKCAKCGKERTVNFEPICYDCYADDLIEHLKRLKTDRPKCTMTVATNNYLWGLQCSSCKEWNFCAEDIRYCPTCGAEVEEVVRA